MRSWRWRLPATAVFTEAAWRSEKDCFYAEGQARRALEARTVDVLHIGEMQPERDHGLQERSTALTYYMGCNGRNIWGGAGKEFASIDIALPEDLTRGKARIAVRIAPGEDNWLSVFEARIAPREE